MRDIHKVPKYCNVREVPKIIHPILDFKVISLLNNLISVHIYIYIYIYIYIKTQYENSYGICFQK